MRHLPVPLVWYGLQQITTAMVACRIIWTYKVHHGISFGITWPSQPPSCLTSCSAVCYQLMGEQDYSTCSALLIVFQETRELVLSSPFLSILPRDHSYAIAEEGPWGFFCNEPENSLMQVFCKFLYQPDWPTQQFGTVFGPAICCITTMMLQCDPYYNMQYDPRRHLLKHLPGMDWAREGAHYVRGKRREKHIGKQPSVLFFTYQCTLSSFPGALWSPARPCESPQMRNWSMQIARTLTLSLPLGTRHQLAASLWGWDIDLALWSQLSFPILCADGKRPSSRQNSKGTSVGMHSWTMPWASFYSKAPWIATIQVTISDPNFAICAMIMTTACFIGLAKGEIRLGNVNFLFPSLVSLFQ